MRMTMLMMMTRWKDRVQRNPGIFVYKTKKGALEKTFEHV